MGNDPPQPDEIGARGNVGIVDRHHSQGVRNTPGVGVALSPPKTPTLVPSPTHTTAVCNIFSFTPRFGMYRYCHVGRRLCAKRIKIDFRVKVIVVTPEGVMQWARGTSYDPVDLLAFVLFVFFAWRQTLDGVSSPSCRQLFSFFFTCKRINNKKKKIYTNPPRF